MPSLAPALSKDACPSMVKDHTHKSLSIDISEEFVGRTWAIRIAEYPGGSMNTVSQALRLRCRYIYLSCGA